MAFAPENASILSSSHTNCASPSMGSEAPHCGGEIVEALQPPPQSLNDTYGTAFAKSLSVDKSVSS